MIWTLRNISILIWISSLVSIPVSFITLTGLMRFFPNISPVWVGSSSFIIVVGLLAVLNSFISKKIILGMIKEAQAWERSGVIPRAEKKYIRAIRVYDSFLLWPFGMRKTVQALLSAISRFQLNTERANDNFKKATSVYLRMNPSDREISRLWLRQLRRSSIVTADEQDILTLLSESHETDSELSGLIAEIFLGLERRDFSAQKLYAQIKKNPELDVNYAGRIQEIIGNEEELKTDWVPSTPDPMMLTTWKKVKNSSEYVINHLKPIDRLKTIIKGLSSGFQALIQGAGSALSFVVLTIGKIIEYFKTHERSRFYLRTGVLTLVVGWLIFFMAGTISHLLQTKPTQKEKEPVIVELPKPFTIQVAAYLKQSHADRYVGVLKKKGVDANVKKVAGGGKTWFVVRVSEFTDKKSAAEYGQKLKQEKIIDDFFVNNK